MTVESNPVEEGAKGLGDVAAGDAGASLWQTFDRIRAALSRQEVERRKGPRAVEAWAEKWKPQFDALVADVYEKPYGLALCAWLDWLDERKLAWRGELRWAIPTKGPLTFTPPSTEGLMQEIRKIVGELGLEDALTRSARWSVAPTQKTRGGRGQGTVRQLPPQK